MFFSRFLVIYDLKSSEDFKLSTFNPCNFDPASCIYYLNSKGHCLEVLDDKAIRILFRELKRCQFYYSSFFQLGKNFVSYYFYFYYDTKPSFIYSEEVRGLDKEFLQC